MQELNKYQIEIIEDGIKDGYSLQDIADMLPDITVDELENKINEMQGKSKKSECKEIEKKVIKEKEIEESKDELSDESPEIDEELEIEECYRDSNIKKVVNNFITRYSKTTDFESSREKTGMYYNLSEEEITIILRLYFGGDRQAQDLLHIVKSKNLKEFEINLNILSDKLEQGLRLDKTPQAIAEELNITDTEIYLLGNFVYDGIAVLKDSITKNKRIKKVKPYPNTKQRFIEKQRVLILKYQKTQILRKIDKDAKKKKTYNKSKEERKGLFDGTPLSYNENAVLNGYSNNLTMQVYEKALGLKDGVLNYQYLDNILMSNYLDISVIIKNENLYAFEDVIYLRNKLICSDIYTTERPYYLLEHVILEELYPQFGSIIDKVIMNFLPEDLLKPSGYYDARAFQSKIKMENHPTYFPEVLDVEIKLILLTYDKGEVTNKFVPWYSNEFCQMIANQEHWVPGESKEVHCNYKKLPKMSKLEEALDLGVKASQKILSKRFKNYTDNFEIDRRWTYDLDSYIIENYKKNGASVYEKMPNWVTQKEASERADLLRCKADWSDEEVEKYSNLFFKAGSYKEGLKLIEETEDTWRKEDGIKFAILGKGIFDNMIKLAQKYKDLAEHYERENINLKNTSTYCMSRESYHVLNESDKVELIEQNEEQTVNIEILREQIREEEIRKIKENINVKEIIEKAKAEMENIIHIEILKQLN